MVVVWEMVIGVVGIMVVGSDGMVVALRMVLMVAITVQTRNGDISIVSGTLRHTGPSSYCYCQKTYVLETATTFLMKSSINIFITDELLFVHCRIKAFPNPFHLSLYAVCVFVLIYAPTNAAVSSPHLIICVPCFLLLFTGCHYYSFCSFVFSFSYDIILPKVMSS